MSAINQTLVAEVKVYNEFGVEGDKDVPVYVYQRGRKTVIDISRSYDVGPGGSESVVVLLTEAERIALIEALGGVAS